MLMKNLMASVVVLGFVTWDSIQAQYTYGSNIPDMSMNEIRGKWYMTATTSPRESTRCITYTVKKTPNKKYTIQIVSESRDYEYNGQLTHDTENITLEASFDRFSAVISTRDNYGEGPYIIIFDVNPDSYIAAYMTLKNDRTDIANDGIFFILTRDKRLTSRIFTHVNTAKYVTTNRSAIDLITIDREVCENRELDHV